MQTLFNYIQTTTHRKIAHGWISVALAMTVTCLWVDTTAAQMGGGMGGGAMGGGGAAAPPPEQKPKFREHVLGQDGIAIRREQGDAVVLDVRIQGNRTVGTHRILQALQTRKNRFYDYETVLGDVRRLNDMGSFVQPTFQVEQRDDGVIVTFIVTEREMITTVQFHGNRALNDRELKGRAGIDKSDPLNEFTIESARRRLIDFYQEKGFNQVAIDSSLGIKDDPGAVVFRINEGPLERISSIQVKGNTIVSEARLKKVIHSRGSLAGVGWYIGNAADLKKLDRDKQVLESYYHTLGFLTATVGRSYQYDDSGKWITATYVINEGPRFKINDIQIVGNQFITEESLRKRLELKSGDMFDGTIMRRDVGEITYGYGELGFIYAEVEPKTVMRDEADVVDLVYEITEGDRWRVGEIRVNIEGEPHLMRETTLLNLIDLREGDWIDRRTLELNRTRLERSQLLETNPQVADPPDIKVIPREEYLGTL